MNKLFKKLLITATAILSVICYSTSVFAAGFDVNNDNTVNVNDITFCKNDDNFSVAVNTAPRHNHVRVYMELFRFPVGMQHGNHPGFQAELVLHPVLNGFSRCAHQDIQYFFLVALHQVQ